MSNHRRTRRNWTTLAIAATLAAVALPAMTNGQTRGRQPAEARVRPSHADVAYGEHPQQRIDVYLAEADKPTPLVLYIHGGGFRGGSKSGVNPRPFLDAGISVASIEYRFVQHDRLPAAHHDCRRALQFLRSKAGEWNASSSPR